VIIAIEGLDGSGKTTAARILAEQVSATYAPLPPPKLALQSTALFRDIHSDARYLYYLSGVLVLADMARESDVMVADRFIASAHALHLHVATPLADQLRLVPLPAPELTFYLHADEDVRRQRLRTRGRELDPFERMLESDDLFRHQASAMMQSYPGTHVIDTTHSTPTEVAQRAREVLADIGRSLE
jgi:thymidylate kinase